MPFVAKKSFALSQVTAILFSAGITFIYSIVLFLLAFKVIDRSGRRPMSITGLAFATLTALAVSFAGDHALTTIVLFSLMAVSLLAPGQGPFWAWSVELMPTRLRATGQGIATATGKVGSMIGTFYFPVYLDHVGWTGTMLTYFALMLGQLILVVFFAPETKGTSLLALDREEVVRK
jgi:putative MFS transporter